MNKFQLFLQKIVGLKAERPSPVIPFTPQSAYGLVEPPPLDQEAQLKANRSWVYACVKKRADEVANIKLLLYERKDESDVEEHKTHDVLDLLDQVNSYMTRYDLFEYTSMMWDLAGECFWWKIKNDQGKVISIYPYLMPPNMTVVPSRETFVKGYVYRVPGTAEEIPFKAEDIIHFKFTNPRNPYRGLSPVKAAEYAIGTDKLAAKWNFTFFKNSAKPFGVILYPGTMDNEQYERIKMQWEAGHQGVENAHKVAILDSGDQEGKVKADFKEIGFAQKDMDFIEQRKFNRDEIFAAFGIPKGIMIAEDVNKATAQVHESVFIKGTIIPIYRKLVSYLNEFLLTDFDDVDKFYFDFEDPTIRDVDATLKYYESAIKNGWMSLNEVREAEGFAGFEGGDQIFLPVNMVMVGVTPEGKKRYRPIHIRQRRTKEEKIKDLVKDKLKKLLGAKFKGVKIRKISSKKKRKFFTDEQKEKYIENYIKRADREEAQFKGKLKEFFKGQERRVLKTIKEIKSVSVRFNIKNETQLAITAFAPIVNSLVEEHGEDTMSLLGLTGFDMTVERVEGFLKKEGLKFTKEINKVTKAKILKQIAQGTEAGEGIPTIRDRVMGVFKEARISRATKIARTEVARASNFATVEAYKQSEVVRAKEWVVTPDERLCDYCAPMEGKVVSIERNFFDLGDTFSGNADQPMDIDYGDVEQPPLHANCRCTTIPVLKKSAQGGSGKTYIDNQNQKEKIKKEIKKDIKKEIEGEVLEETLKTIKEAKNG